MSPDDADKQAVDMLAQAFRNLGAEEGSSHVMAAQLLKRARQLAAERGVNEAEALRELFMKVVAGRKGDYAGPDAREGS